MNTIFPKKIFKVKTLLVVLVSMFFLWAGVAHYTPVNTALSQPFSLALDLDHQIVYYKTNNISEPVFRVVSRMHSKVITFKGMQKPKT